MPISGTQWRYLDKLQSWLQPQLPPATGLQARLMIAQISQLQTQIHRIEEEIDRQAPFEAAAQRLMEVPGLGKVGVWTILAEIGDITRFPSAKQFVSYCRLVPGAKDSGGARCHKSVNKDGNKYLRAAFGQAAVSAYTHYKVVKKFYRKVKRRSVRPVARAVVVRNNLVNKLITITCAIWNSREPYDPDHQSRFDRQKSAALYLIKS